jgi:PKD repeat protein
VLLSGSQAAAQDVPVEVRFTVGHANCGGPATFQFFINGTAVTGPTAATVGCTCNTTPLVVVVNDPVSLALIGPIGCTGMRMDLVADSLAVGYVRADITRSMSGVETYCFGNFGGPPGCADRELCDGFTFVATSSYTGNLTDTDGDGNPNCTDPDDDGDTVLDAADNCPLHANLGQEDSDNDGAGDACDLCPQGTDSDLDLVCDSDDNCSAVANTDQADQDRDGVGNVCDNDRDGDGRLNAADNCPDVANPGQQDTNGDGSGDVCEVLVITVPLFGDPSRPHEIWSGGSLRLQGVARVRPDLTITSGTWDPGDGSGPQPISVANLRVLELDHTYAGADGTPFVARLAVTASNGVTYSDTFRVVIKPMTLDVEIGRAIDHGLWYLHNEMSLGMAGGVPTGFWTEQSVPGATGAVVQAFEVNNHLETGDLNEDPYAEDVMRGLSHLTTELTPLNISVQPAGNPDSNGNGIGLGSQSDPVHINYNTSQVAEAIVASGAPNTRARTGGAQVLGRTYRDIIQDIVDMFAFGQADTGGPRGGWQYQLNAGADNSASHWCALVGIGAERVFGLATPSFVKEENLNFWVDFSQNFDGSNTGVDGMFGYADRSPIISAGTNTTGSGLVELIFDGLLSDAPRFKAAERYLERNWTVMTTENTIYGLYSTAKGFRLARPAPIVLVDGTFDWYRSDTQAGDARDGVSRHFVRNQQPSGRWDSPSWVINHIATAWTIIICSNTIFQRGPEAACEVEPAEAGLGEPVSFDGTRSFHNDPMHRIILYEWDFEGDGSFDATGATAMHSYPVAGTYAAVLRVTDDNVPPIIDTVSCGVLVLNQAVTPNSNPGGPYSICLVRNDTVVLDGTGSSDPDGAIVAYGWDFDPQPLDVDFDDASTPTVDATAFFRGLGPGTYDVGLRVRDNDGRTNVDFTTVTVHGSATCPNRPPTADFTADTSGGLVVAFDGSLSTDPDGDETIVRYDWMFGDSQMGTGILPMHTYAAPGTYMVKLTVTDDVGAMHMATKEITVTEVEGFRRGDFNGSRSQDAIDLQATFDYLWSGDPSGARPMSCIAEVDLDSADANDNEWITVADYLSLRSHLESGGALAPPAAVCGADPDNDQRGFDLLDPAYRVTAGNLTVLPPKGPLNRTIFLPVNVDTAVPISGLQLILEYDDALTPYSVPVDGEPAFVSGLGSSCVLAAEGKLVIGLWAEEDGGSVIEGAPGRFQNVGTVRFHLADFAVFPPLEWLAETTVAGVRYRASVVDLAFSDHHPALLVGEYEFARGNSNNDEAVDISDAICTLGYLFQPNLVPGCLDPGSEVHCPDAADANNDSVIDISDPIFSLNFLFQGGRRIPLPFPQCGLDQGPIDLLGCNPCSCPPFRPGDGCP